MGERTLFLKRLHETTSKKESLGQHLIGATTDRGKFCTLSYSRSWTGKSTSLGHLQIRTGSCSRYSRSRICSTTARFFCLIVIAQLTMSGSTVTPPWLKEEGYSPPNTSSGYSPVPVNASYAPPQQGGVPAPTSQPQAAGAPLPMKLTTILFTLKIVTILLCVLMDITAVIGIGYIDAVDEVGEFFVAAYMLFFGTLLLFFELMSFRKIEWIDHWFRRNCGFLYSALGKSLFIIFIAFLCFGLGDPQTLTLSTGLALAAFGSLQVGLYLKYPEVFEDTNEVVR